MTSALLDRPAGSTATVPDAPRRRLLPQLLPVPDSEPPLSLLPGPDDAAFGADRSVPEPGAWPRTNVLHDGHRRAAAGRQEQAHADTNAAPTMVHRRWPVAVEIITEPRHGIQAEGAHRVHTAVGVVGSSGGHFWPAAATRTGTARIVRPAASDIAVVLTRATIEALSGRRPFAQLRPHFTTGVFDGLQEFPMLGHRRESQLASLWVCEPTDGTAEISAAFRCGGRMRAMAMQLRADGTRWLVTSLQLG